MTVNGFMYKTNAGGRANILRKRSHYVPDTENLSNVSCNGFHLYLFAAANESRIICWR